METAVFSLGVGAFVHSHTGSLAWWFAQVFLGSSMFRFFVIGHECGHNSLFRRSWASTTFGLYASVFSGVPYVPWRNIHRLHHRWVGVIDKDPTQAELLTLRRFSKLKNALFWLVWVTWLPAMFLVFIVRSFYLYPLARLRAKEWSLALQGLGSVAVCCVPRAALVAWLGWGQAALILLPMTFVFLFIDENVSLPQHTGLFPFLSDTHPKPIPYAQQDEVTRTTSQPGWLPALLALNFNLHVEHHLFPSAPWYRLPELTRRLRQLPTYKQMNFAAYMASIRTKSPVDVYTRALPTPRENGKSPNELVNLQSGTG
jgi:fatty acid desaturase